LLCSFILCFSIVTSTKTCFAQGAGVIYIRADGSIDSPTALISTIDNVTYVLTGDINDQSIFVERSNITIDWRGHVLQGSYVNFSCGMCLSNVTDATVKSGTIEAFCYGIFFDYGSNNTIGGNNVTDNIDAIHFQYSANNSIHENSITDNSGWGVVFVYSHNETLFGNNITDNHNGVCLARALSRVREKHRNSIHFATMLRCQH
jgi:parallel beta-helix repeat protein